MIDCLCRSSRVRHIPRIPALSMLMNLPLRLLISGAWGLVTLIASANAQVRFPGIEEPRDQNTRITRSYSPSQKKAAEEFPHVLYYHDGYRLRGELLSINGNDIVWRRPGVSDSLHVPSSTVRMILLQNHDDWIQSEFFDPVHPGPDSIRATLKLSGDDWITGTATSEDGQSFSVEWGGEMLAIPREKIAWLRYDTHAAPEFSLWEGFDRAQRRIVGGVLSIPPGEFIGREIGHELFVAQRFALSFEMPDGGDQATELWLEPGVHPGALPGQTLSGTVRIRLGNAQLEVTQFQANERAEGPRLIEVTSKVPIPPAARQARGALAYQFLYDGAGKKLAALCHSQIVGKWKLVTDPTAPTDSLIDNSIIGAVVLTPSPASQAGLKLRSIRLSPWDGVTLKNPEPAVDQLIPRTGAPISGNLEALTPRNITISGQASSVQMGQHLQLKDSPKEITFSTEERLNLGVLGQIDAANLHIENGKVTCNTAFQNSLTFSVAALASIRFSQPPLNAQPDQTCLAFSNGDILHGSLADAAAGQSIRWKTSTGQVLEIPWENLKGVVFRKPLPPESRRSALAEMENGDRLSCSVKAIDDKSVDLKSDALGSLHLPRESFLRLFPSPQLAPYYITWNPEPLSTELPAAFGVKLTQSVTFHPANPIDGIFGPSGVILAEHNTQFSNAAVVETSTFSRYEFSFDVATEDNSLPRFELIFAGADKSQSHAHIYTTEDGMLRVAIRLTKTGDRIEWRNRQVWWVRQLKKLSPFLNVRVFVDTESQRALLFFNGVPILQIAPVAGDDLTDAGKSIELIIDPDAKCANVRIAPWNNDRPGSEPTGEYIVLANGDITTGRISTANEDQLTMENDLGQLQIPLNTVQAVGFDHIANPTKAAVKLWFIDGSMIQADAFRWAGDSVAFHSPVLGDQRILAAMLNELIFHPEPFWVSEQK